MAGTLNTPDVLTQPIANNGTKNQIPNTNDQSLGLMSQSTGFPAICSERIADGGKAPRRADFNGAFNLVSQHHFFLQNGGTETFRQSVSDAIGGYPLNSRLWFTNSNGESVIVRSLIQNNTYNFNNDPSYIDGIHWVVDVESGAPVGSLMPYAGTTPPDGWLICDGSEISRTTYARLFSVIGTTYGAGDGNSSFNLPDFTGRVPVYDSGSAIGATSDGKLPNITGEFYVDGNNGPSNFSGAFSAGSGIYSYRNRNSDHATLAKIQFNANNVSAVYNDGQTSVVPANVNCFWCIKY